MSSQAGSDASNASIASKYGDDSRYELSADVAAKRIDAYHQILRASLAAQTGKEVLAPALRLSVEQLRGLFSSRQLELLIEPLAPRERSC
jgi:hypothetical protein